MADRSQLEIKQTLLELQKALRNSQAQKSDSSLTTEESFTVSDMTSNSAEDILYVLRELRLNQQKMLDLLVEINRKLE